ncbi:MAG: hypothetical protein ACTSPV_01270 [Candidatus Hodarchaeales archaeon]
MDEEKSIIKADWRKKAVIIGFTIIFIIFLSTFFLWEYLEEKRNINLCKTLNGTYFIYAFDQPYFLCRLNDGRIIDLNMGLEVKFENETRIN